MDGQDSDASDSGIDLLIGDTKMAVPLHFTVLLKSSVDLLR